MVSVKRTGLGFRVVLAVAATASTIDCGLLWASDDSARPTLAKATSEQAPGKAPPIPREGSLAGPRSLHQVGLPTELTRSVIPRDNSQTPEKIALGQQLFFEGRLT